MQRPRAGPLFASVKNTADIIPASVTPVWCALEEELRGDARSPKEAAEEVSLAGNSPRVMQQPLLLHTGECCARWGSALCFLVLQMLPQNVMRFRHIHDFTL